MPISSDRLPNTPLGGEELKAVVLYEASQLLDDTNAKLIEALTAKLDADQLFGKIYAHPRVKFTLSLKCHWSNLNLPTVTHEVSAGEESGAGDDAQHFIDHTEREYEVSNPNLTRLAAHVPIKSVNVERPSPEKPFGAISVVEVPIQPGDYPTPPPHTETNRSDELAKEKQIPESRRFGRGRR